MVKPVTVVRVGLCLGAWGVSVIALAQVAPPEGGYGPGYGPPFYGPRPWSERVAPSPGGRMVPPPVPYGALQEPSWVQPAPRGYGPWGRGPGYPPQERAGAYPGYPGAEAWPPPPAAPSSGLSVRPEAPPAARAAPAPVTAPARPLPFSTWMVAPTPPSASAGPADSEVRSVLDALPGTEAGSTAAGAPDAAAEAPAAAEGKPGPARGSERPGLIERWMMPLRPLL